MQSNPITLRRLFVLSAALLAATQATAEQPAADGLKLFEAKIRPVLVQRCYQCHSVAAEGKGKLQGNLLLDTRAGIRKGGESGPAIVPGDVDSSLLISALRHESFKMPPDSKLAAEVVADFVQWVKLGAPDPRDAKPTATAKRGQLDLDAGRRFWSFQPLIVTEIPEVTNTAWIRNDIDRFILSKLEGKGLAPNGPASRATLVRRVYYDLWGLPPTPTELEAAVNDPSKKAYEALIDRLLDGQHYGERWARHWLDLARFAESNGYAFDKDRPGAYHYRDFVIKALNEDMAYDRFVQLQLAGDQLDPNDYMAQSATGFLAAGPFTSQQTQKERERSRYEQLDDVVGTIGTSMLGLTIGCARCHDHKFDPLPTRDYYRFVACFAETGFQDFAYDSDPVATKAALDSFNAAHQPLVAAREKFENEQLPDRLTEWLKTSAAPDAQATLSDWRVIGPFSAANFKAAFAQVFPPETEIDLTKAYDQRRWTPQPGWVDGQVHNTLTGDNSANYLYRTIDVDQAGPLRVSLGRDDAIKVWLNGKSVLAKEVSGGAAADQDIVTLALQKGSNQLLLKIVNGSGPSGFYFNIKTTIPADIQKILDLAEEQRNKQQKQKLLKWFAPLVPEWAALNAAEQEHLKKKPQPNILNVFAARRNGTTYNFGADTRKVYFLARGNSNSKQGPAPPGFLRVLVDSGRSSENWLGSVEEEKDRKQSATPAVHPRVAAASWITDERNGAGHLLARVIVNRLWQHHLGRGIVATPSDFGSQGVAPTHPELLDYLAAELIRGGWKLKPIHKLIMTSAVYRQSGRDSEVASKLDPDNNLWWRRGAKRLEAEIIRDALLSVSGGLDKTMFGKGSLDQAMPRRSIYLTVKRSNLIPFLQLFDSPDAIQSIGDRDITTVPPQALAMMNSPFVRQVAERFAKRLRPAGKGTTEDVVELAYLLALSRSPSESERTEMVQFIHEQTKSYGDDSGGTDRAVADFCQLVLCLNEFIFVD